MFTFKGTDLKEIDYILYFMQEALFGLNIVKILIRKINLRAFPVAQCVKNPPANARDTGLIPDSGRFHMPQSS